MMNQAPRVVGRYLVWEAIASGGMASVHFARLFGPEGFSRTVAIKQLHPLLAQDSEFLALLSNEARLASRIRHPNVVSPLDVVKLDEELFIVMDYIHGESLARLMRAEAKLAVPASICCAILTQVLLGLHAAHGATSEHGDSLDIVHRDISPSNILVGQDGAARVVDFGIAKASSNAQITADGNVKGKFGYMAPEQLHGRVVDRRTDLFAAGIVLWEMLTGVRLFPGDTPAAVVEKILHSPIVAPSELVPGAPSKLSDVVMRALAMRPDDRYPDARTMAIALGDAVLPASALEVGEWVTSLCGAALEARARRIAEIETVSLSEITLPRLAMTSLAASAAPVAVARVSEPPPRSGATETSLSRTPEPAPAMPRNRSPKRTVLVVGAVAIGIVSLLLAAKLPKVLDASEATATSLQVNAHSSPSPSQLLVPKPPKSVVLDPSASAVHAAPKPSVDPTPQLTKPGTTSVGGASRKPAAKPVSKPEGAPDAKGSRADCEVLYTVDKAGVKRFKSECF